LIAQYSHPPGNLNLTPTAVIGMRGPGTASRVVKINPNTNMQAETNTPNTPPHAAYFRRGFMVLAASLALLTPGLEAAVGDEHLVMGNPSAATTDVRKGANYLVRKEEYVLSYNNKTSNPNWVSWHLNNSWRGAAKRKDDFAPDMSLPTEWFRVFPKDYKGSGFDKGHMCNSEDRTKNQAANSATFLMSNMVPQAPKNNEHTWEALEAHCRKIADKGKELYIISGPSGVGGTGANGKMSQLEPQRATGPTGKIVVPARTWKVVLILPPGKTSPTAVTAEAQAIAVIMPNTESIDLDWTKYIVRISDVEKLTGYHFFSNIDPVVAKRIKGTKYALAAK
jgi:endonuclease G